MGLTESSKMRDQRCNFESCLHSNLRYLKYKVAAPDHGSTIALVLFLCPSTGDRVQRWFADNGSEDGGEMGGEMYEWSDPLLLADWSAPLTVDRSWVGN